MVISVQTPVSLEEATISGAVGIFAFPSLLGLAQVAIHRPLRLCNALRFPAASVLGGLTVCAAGALSSLAVARTCSLLQALGIESLGPPHRNSVTFTGEDLVLSTAMGCALFRTFGGRFSSVLPSNILKPGAFGYEWIPAKGAQYATTWEKDWIQQLGKRYGCHTCGRRRGVVKFSADHQPPSKLVSNGDPGVQKFYPQCDSCSGLQGGVISNGAWDRSSMAIVAHPYSLRAHHLFLPTPLIILGLKSPVESSSSVLSPLSRVVVAVAKEVGETEEVETRGTQTQQATTLQAEQTSSESPPAAQSVRHDSNSAEFEIRNCPLFIFWKNMVQFLDSFNSPIDCFHITLWVFTLVAACGTI